MTNKEELERKQKELKSRLEVADNLEERKLLRLELREIRQKLFSTSPKKEKKEETLLANDIKDENNNVISTDVKPEAFISQNIKPKEAVISPDEKTTESEIISTTPIDSKVTSSVRRITVIREDNVIPNGNLDNTNTVKTLKDNRITVIRKDNVVTNSNLDNKKDNVRSKEDSRITFIRGNNVVSNSNLDNKEDKEVKSKEEIQYDTRSGSKEHIVNKNNGKILTEKQLPKEETKDFKKEIPNTEKMSITIRTSARPTETDSNNNSEPQQYSPAERAVSASERAARRAKRNARQNIGESLSNVMASPAPDVNGKHDDNNDPDLSNGVSRISMDEDDTPKTPTSPTKPTVKVGSSVSARMSAMENSSSNGPRKKEWSPQKTTPKYGAQAGKTNFQFGLSYTKKDNPGTAASSRPAPGKLGGSGTYKYTPTVTNRAKSSTNTFPTRTFGGAGGAGRFSGVPKNDPPKPSFGAPAAADGGDTQSASDRMAYFRESMEKERKAAEAKKAKEEEKKKLEEERKKKEEEDKKKEEEEKNKPEEDDAADSDKPKNKSSAPACKKREKKPARRTMSISNIVLDWVQEMTKDYPGVEIKNFSTSWANGLAFCALIHHFNPDEFDFNELKPENKRYNFDLAFETGSKAKNIPILLDTNDMVRMKKPEPRSVQTYIQWIWSVYGPTSGYGPTPEEVQQAQLA